MNNSSPAQKRKKVVIVQRRMTHYRIPVFTGMKEFLSYHGIDLDVIYGDPTEAEKLKNDSGELNWGTYVPCQYYFHDKFCWQGIGHQLKNADLVIVTQEAKLLYNYLLILFPRPYHVAYWGHGKNFHAGKNDLLVENLKIWLLKKVDWWFAYTDQTLKVLIHAQYPIEKITVLNNAVDTNLLQQDLASISELERNQFKASLGLGAGPIGIMLGSLYPEKRIGFLLQSLEKIKEKIPNFQLLIVGDGPDRVIIEKAIQDKREGVYWAGARTGYDKAILLSMATVMLNPGMFGLTILDAFAAKLPLLLTEFKTSMPESAYLTPNFNCLISSDNINDYANLVVNFLSNTGLQEKLKSGCEYSSREFTVEKMINNFCGGILEALNQ